MILQKVNAARMLSALALIAIALVLAAQPAIAKKAFAATNPSVTATTQDATSSAKEDGASPVLQSVTSSTTLTAESPEELRVQLASSSQFTIKAQIIADGAINYAKSAKVGGAHYLFLPSHASLKELRIANSSKLTSIYVSSSGPGARPPRSR